MLRLILIRHAKSSWDIPGQSDHERTLNARGRLAAPLLGRWVAETVGPPDHALVSTARRAQETWSLLRECLGAVPATAAPDLYEAEPDALLRAIRGAPPAATLALVGHNPGIGETARRLIDRAPASPIFRKYPTGATAVIGFDCPDWAGVTWGTGQLIDFATPGELAEPRR